MPAPHSCPLAVFPHRAPSGLINLLALNPSIEAVHAGELGASPGAMRRAAVALSESIVFFRQAELL